MGGSPVTEASVGKNGASVTQETGEGDRAKN
jgi:hypothetical protein